MADLADAIYHALTGRQGRAAARPSFGDMIVDAIRHRAETGQSRRAMAKSSGIPESTLRRWEKGERPTAKQREQRYGQLLTLWRHIHIKPSTEHRWRNNDITITIDNFPEGRGKFGTRTLTAAKLELAAGTGDRVVDRYLAGDDRGAAKAFVNGVQEDWYHETVFGGWMDDDLGGEGHDVDSDYSLVVSAG